jgi:hypothetical protein
VQDYFRKQINEYRYNTVLRTYLELYLDLVLFSLMGFYNFKFDCPINGTSTIIALLIFVKEYLSLKASPLI